MWLTANLYKLLPATVYITWQENLIRHFPAKEIASTELLIDNWHITDHKQGNQCEKHLRAKVKSHTSHTSFRSYPPCRRIQIPSLIFSAYLQSFLSHWHPALIGRNIFFLTVHENGTLWDSLYMFNTIFKVMYHHAMCCVTSAAPLILLSATQILESSWICVSFIKHKIRKTVYPNLCRFRKKVSFDLFGWTACWSKSFKANLSSWVCTNVLFLKKTSQQGEIKLPPESTKLKSESDFWRHFRVSCHARWETKSETLV